MRPTSPNSLGLATLAATLLLVAPAAASSALMCEGEGGMAVVNLASLPVVQAIGAYAEIGGRAYSTGPERGEGEPFVVGQAFGEGDAVMIDFVDPNFEDILVGLRVTFIGGDDDLWTGTLRAGETLVDVTCTAG